MDKVTNAPTMSQKPKQPSSDFVMQLIQYQDRIFAYILTLSANVDQANELLQETNLTLLEKSGEYRADGNFIGWASKIAYFHCLTHRRDTARSKLVLRDDLVQLLVDEYEPDPDPERRQKALEACVENLDGDSKTLVHARYKAGTRLATVAEALGINVNTASKRLERIRAALRRCIEDRLAGGAA